MQKELTFKLLRYQVVTERFWTFPEGFLNRRLAQPLGFWMIWMIIAEKSLSRVKNKERINVKSFRSVRRFIRFTNVFGVFNVSGFYNLCKGLRCFKNSPCCFSLLLKKIAFYIGKRYHESNMNENSRLLMRIEWNGNGEQ